MSKESSGESKEQPLKMKVPLFPLPNMVLLPRAVLPLHIFEERYKAMMAIALEGNRQIAMALLKSGWEKNYHGAAPIEPVVCIGTILAHERLNDGQYNLLLQGHVRASVVRELTLHPFRTAELEMLVETPVIELDLSNQRQQFVSMFSNGRFSSVPMCQRFLEMLSGPMPTSEITDVIAFNLIEDVQIKQRLLAERDPRRRAERVASILEQSQILSSLKPGESNSDASLN